jgi:hypothetical protein
MGKAQSTTKLNGTSSHAINKGFVRPRDVNDCSAVFAGIASMRVNAPVVTSAVTVQASNPLLALPFTPLKTGEIAYLK